MEYSIAIYFLLFIMYSVAGWILEVICKSIEDKKFVNRGFMIGPYCPIYGCGAIVITLLLSRYKNDWIVLFFMSIITCGILEYATSYVMEKLFHARWWDYSKKKYNINGRICLETLVPFGILGLLITYITNPFILSNLSKVEEQRLNIIAIVISVIFFIDLAISLKVISNVRVTSTRLNKEDSNDTTDNTEEITAKVKEILRGKSVLNRRLINAYPDLKAIIKKKKEEIRQKVEEVKDDIKEKTEEVKDEVKQKLGETKEDIKEKIKKLKIEQRKDDE